MLGKCYSNTTVSAGKCDPKTGNCSGATNCKNDGDCGKPTCKQSSPTLCQQSPWCNLGKCTSIPKYVPNTICSATTGQCGNTSTTCTKAADCGKPTCTSLFGACEQKEWLCTSGKCSQTSKVLNNAKCDAASGKCQATSGCTKDADCGKPLCMQLLNACHQTLFKCVAGQCLTQILTFPKGKCDSSTGKCSGQTTCNKNSDCGNPTCVMQNKICYQLLPTCTGGKCFTQASTSTTKKCDVFTGLCK